MPPSDHHPPEGAARRALAVVTGVAALLAAHPGWFRAIQYAGTAYLAWIGLKLLFAREGDAPPIRIEPHHYLRQALLITLLICVGLYLLVGTAYAPHPTPQPPPHHRAQHLPANPRFCPLCPCNLHTATPLHPPPPPTLTPSHAH